MSTDSKTRSREYFDRQAHDYDNSSDGKFVAPMYAEMLERIAGIAPASLLDVGCGTGNLLLPLADSGISLHGVDLSKEMVLVARERLAGRAEVIVADAQSLPYPDECMDLIVCNASFHHYPRPGDVLREMNRVLRHDGRLLIGDPNPPAVLRGLMNFFVRFSEGGDFRFYSRRQFGQMLSGSGFEMTDWRKPNYKVCILEAKKTNPPCCAAKKYPFSD